MVALVAAKSASFCFRRWRKPHMLPCGSSPRKILRIMRGPKKLGVPAAQCSLATALSAVVAQLEGSALGLVGLAHVVLAAANLNFIQGAVLVLVIGAAVDGALDTGVGLIIHDILLLVFGIQGEYAPMTAALFFRSKN